MQMDMTTGDPGKIILTFIKPMIIGNIFQQMYSMADTVIVGQCLGVKALAAVGLTGNIMGMLLGFLMGFTTGLTILCSQRFGAKDMDGLKRSVVNAIRIAIVVTILGTGISVALIDKVLVWMNTPADIYNLSSTYIRIICYGFLFMVAYNMCASMLRAIGNSRTPLVFLILSSALNIILDFVLILRFHLGVAGAAYATIFSQGISVILCIVYIARKVPALHPQKAHIRPISGMTRSQLSVGIPMALQYSITAIGCVILQSILNKLGSNAIAGYTAASKIEALITQPYPALGMTLAAYAAQNKGKGDIPRIQKGIQKGLKYCLGYSLLAFAVVNTILPYVVPMFVSGSIQEVLHYAIIFTLIDSLFYLPLGCIFLYRESIQGSGHAIFPMIGGVVELASRIVFSIVAARHLNFAWVCMANAGTWLVTAGYILFVYYVVFKKKL